MGFAKWQLLLICILSRRGRSSNLVLTQAVRRCAYLVGVRGSIPGCVSSHEA